VSLVLEIEELSVRLPVHYGVVPVLERVELTVEAGETLGIVGESGSGKSLLGLAVLGLLPPTAVATGRVLVAGTEMVGAGERVRAGARGRLVSHVYQDALSALNPNRRIGAHFADVWRSAGGQEGGWRARALGWCERVALGDADRVLASYPHQLSGGMRQRVLIALALFRSPQLLVADEPTTALDRATALDVLRLLRSLQLELGMAMVLISHDFGIVRNFCDRVAVLYAGQVCELGETASVVAEPRHRYTAALLESVESLRRGAYPLASVAGVVPVPNAYPDGCRFRDRCVAATSVCAGTRPSVESAGRRAWCFHPVGAPVSETALR
jgi:oligopeptide/dipeptide ABC transporter ATP-binding protein